MIAHVADVSMNLYLAIKDHQGLSLALTLKLDLKLEVTIINLDTNLLIKTYTKTE